MSFIMPRVVGDVVVIHLSTLAAASRPLDDGISTQHYRDGLGVGPDVAELVKLGNQARRAAAMSTQKVGSDGSADGADAVPKVGRSRMMTVKEVAYRMKIGERAVRKQCERHKLNAERVSGRWLIEMDEGAN